MWAYIIPIVGFAILAWICVKVMPKNYTPPAG